MTRQSCFASHGRPYHDQPQWRNDFPTDWPQDEFVAAGDFTKFLVLTSFAFVAGQLWIVAENFVRKRKGQLPVMRVARADAIPRVFVFIALAAWLVTFVGLVRNLLRMTRA